MAGEAVNLCVSALVGLARNGGFGGEAARANNESRLGLLRSQRNGILKLRHKRPARFGTLSIQTHRFQGWKTGKGFQLFYCFCFWDVPQFEGSLGRHGLGFCWISRTGSLKGVLQPVIWGLIPATDFGNFSTIWLAVEFDTSLSSDGMMIGPWGAWKVGPHKVNMGELKESQKGFVDKELLGVWWDFGRWEADCDQQRYKSRKCVIRLQSLNGKAWGEISGLARYTSGAKILWHNEGSWAIGYLAPSLTKTGKPARAQTCSPLVHCSWKLWCGGRPSSESLPEELILLRRTAYNEAVMRYLDRGCSPASEVSPNEYGKKDGNMLLQPWSLGTFCHAYPPSFYEEEGSISPVPPSPPIWIGLLL
nr:L-type lectin-domain containing receptor kinase S.4-like [Ipomoea batatas]